MFRQIKGQEHALKILQLARDNDRISQAYLFHGADGVGKFTTALYFGMAVNCLSKSEFRPCGVCSSCRKFLAFDHPDFIYVFPTPNLQMNSDGEFKTSDGQRQYEAYIRNKIETPWNDHQFKSGVEIRRDNISLLIKRLDLSIYEANYRICIIEDADEMNIPTANAFLKTLEEPPRSTLVFLLTSHLSMLLPTIVSRCQPIHFPPLAPAVIEGILLEKFNVNPEIARMAAKIADGSVKRAVKLTQSDASAIRDRAFEIIQMAAAEKDLAFYNSVNTAVRHNAETVTELIKHLCLFAGDLNLIHSFPEQITNVDKRDWLQAVTAPLFEADPDRLGDRVLNFMLEMEDLQRKVSGNVNLSLVMQNLYFKLCQIFRG